MAYTYLTELNKKLDGTPIETPSRGSADTFKALYYFKDIELLQKQKKFKELKELNVWFIRSDVDPELHEITILVAVDADGNLIENDPNDHNAEDEEGTDKGKGALPWPAYYDRSGTDRGDPDAEIPVPPASHGGTSDFPGDEAFGAGSILLSS